MPTIFQLDIFELERYLNQGGVDHSTMDAATKLHKYMYRHLPATPPPEESVENYSRTKDGAPIITFELEQNVSKKRWCGKCAGCTREACGKCPCCLDMPKVLW